MVITKKTLPNQRLVMYVKIYARKLNISNE